VISLIADYTVIIATISVVGALVLIALLVLLQVIRYILKPTLFYRSL